MQTEGKGISGCWLKMFAVVTMLTDHIAAVILVQYPVLDTLYMWMRVIGRIAFPIYCFLLVEGYFHTRSRAKYAFRLFLFALISEIPFDMAFNHSFWYSSYNNVFFTLLIGLLTIWAADALKRGIVKERYGAVAPAMSVMMRLAVLCGGCFAASFLCTDYGATGILAIYVIYALYERRMKAMFAAVTLLGLLGGFIEFAAYIVLVPLRCYDGTRGKQIKYFFYVFYPAHLLILALLATALGVGMSF